MRIDNEFTAPAEESPEPARTGSDQASTVAEAEQGPGEEQAVSAVQVQAKEIEEAEGRGSAGGGEGPGSKTEREQGTDQVEPFNLGRVSVEAIAQRVWPVLAVMVVIAGIIVGYVAFG